MVMVQVTSLRRMFHSVTQEVRLGLKFGGGRKCVVCSTARAEVAFVPFREGVESSGNKSRAHGRVGREVVSGRGPRAPAQEQKWRRRWPLGSRPGRAAAGSLLDHPGGGAGARDTHPVRAASFLEAAWGRGTGHRPLSP